MERKAVSGIMLTLLLICMLTLAFNIQPVKASGTIYIRADGSIDPSTAPIQRVGDIYTFTENIYDSIVVERNNIVINGDGYTLQGTGASGSKGIDLSGRTNVTVRNMQIKNFYYGIWLDSSNYNSINGNNITANNSSGIYFISSSNNSVSGNNIANNHYVGIVLLASSTNNSITGNVFINDGLDVWESSYNNSVENNTVNGKPLVYLEGVASYVVDNAGQVILFRCNGIRVENLNLSNASIGVKLLETKNTIISNSIIANNYNGIWLDYSYNNSIYGNKVTKNNWHGIFLTFSSCNNSVCGNNITANKGGGIWFALGSSKNSICRNNIANNNYGISLYNPLNETIISHNNFFHNNFIDNTIQVYIQGFSYVNVWDDGYPSGGNYWSDYSTRYPNAQELDDSGIWNTPYVINENNTDNYPLMKPWTPTLTATVDIDPDTLNLKSNGKWIIAYVQLPKGYSAAEINASSILLNGTVAPVLDPKYGWVKDPSGYLVDHNNDGILERMVKLDRAAVESFISSQGIGYGNVALTMTGELFDGTPFEGTDIIFVVYGGAGGRRK